MAMHRHSSPRYGPQTVQPILCCQLTSRRRCYPLTCRPMRQATRLPTGLQLVRPIHRCRPIRQATRLPTGLQPVRPIHWCRRSSRPCSVSVSLILAAIRSVVRAARRAMAAGASTASLAPTVRARWTTTAMAPDTAMPIAMSTRCRPLSQPYGQRQVRRSAPPTSPPTSPPCSKLCLHLLRRISPRHRRRIRCRQRSRQRSLQPLLRAVRQRPHQVRSHRYCRQSRRHRRLPSCRLLHRPHYRRKRLCQHRPLCRLLRPRRCRLLIRRLYRRFGRLRCPRLHHIGWCLLSLRSAWADLRGEPSPQTWRAS